MWFLTLNSTHFGFSQFCVKIYFSIVHFELKELFIHTSMDYIFVSRTIIHFLFPLLPHYLYSSSFEMVFRKEKHSYNNTQAHHHLTHYFIGSKIRIQVCTKFTVVQRQKYLPWLFWIFNLSETCIELTDIGINVICNM